MSKFDFILYNISNLIEIDFSNFNISNKEIKIVNTDITQKNQNFDKIAKENRN